MQALQLSLRTRIMLILIATAAVSIVVSVAGFFIADRQFRTVRDETTRTVEIQSLAAKLDQTINDEYAEVRNYILAAGVDPTAAERASANWKQLVLTEDASYQPDSESATQATREARFAHWLFPDPLSPQAQSATPNCSAAFESLRDFCNQLYGPNGVQKSNWTFRGDLGSGSFGARAIFTQPSNAAFADAVALLKKGQDDFTPLRAELGDLRRALGTSTGLGVDARLDQISSIQTGFLFGGLAAALLMLAVSLGLLNRWVAAPLRRMVSVARRVEAGEDASFGLGRTDEIGQLGSALETMRVRMSEQRSAMANDAKIASTMNRFMDAAAFVEDEASLAGAALDALAELTGVVDGVIHIATIRHDRATMEAQSGGYNPGDISIGEMDNCPGVRRGALYTTPDLDRALSVRCQVYVANQGALACLPLMAAGEAVGVAHLHWREPRTIPLQLRVAMSRITDHAGMTLANRRLLTALRGQSQVDAHTGLLGTRAFDEALDKATSGRRHGHRLAVLLIDLDRFSAFNDRNGTPAGDDALRFFARTLNGCLRDGDLAARYGSEEFAVLLPEMSGSQALEVAERIRQKTEATVLPVGRDSNERLSVSIGVATAPHDAQTRVGLLRAADEALHEAKLSGRNRIVSASDLVIEDELATAEPFVRGHMIVIERDVEQAQADLALA